jgi:hypothetical protein
MDGQRDDVAIRVEPGLFTLARIPRALGTVQALTVELSGYAGKFR